MRARAIAACTAMVGSLLSGYASAVLLPVAPPVITAAFGQSVLLDASASSDSDPARTIESYDWSSLFGFVASSPSASIPYIVGSPFPLGHFGAHRLQLTIRNDLGQTASLWTTLDIRSRPPIALPGGPYVFDIAAGVPLHLSSGATDPDLPFGDSLLFAWDFEQDGLFDVFNSSGDLFVSFSDALARFANVGSYTLALRVTDRFGFSDTDVLSLSVIDSSITAIPEPGTLPLVLITLGAMVMIRLRTKPLTPDEGDSGVAHRQDRPMQERK